MKWIIVSVIGLLGLVNLASAEADSGGRDVVQINTILGIPEGSFDFSAPVATVPAGKRLVIQTVSFFRASATTGSIGQLAIQTSVHGVTGDYVLPAATADGLFRPGATLAAKFYADPGTQLLAFFIRTGTNSGIENVSVTITGYYVPALK
jgi:hypothetical protein